MGFQQQSKKEKIVISKAISAKISRIQKGETPRVLDLFSGCGGLSLGFASVGFQIAGGIEIDPEAAVSHAINFHGVEPPDSKKGCLEFARDISRSEPEDVAGELYNGPTNEAIDVLIGGPPCQSYARVGRSKLREVLEHPEAYRIDPRGNLYLRYLDYVRALQPLIIVMENVPDVLNYGGHNVAEETAEVLEDLGYHCKYSLLNSVFYGVPQMRERMFLIAYRRDMGARLSFPDPTHYFDLPRGYHGARQVALKHHNGNGSESEKRFRHFHQIKYPKIDLSPAITAEMALGDLPPITYHLKEKLKRGVRMQSESVRYRRARPSSYASEMREWNGFSSTGEIWDHVIRHLPRDYRIFRRMRPGDQYPQAHRLANRLFEQQLRRLERGGPKISRRSGMYKELLKKFVPPYDPEKFPNKWRKMEADYPARTVMAHLGKDSYSHIHYDSDQARTISVREAARLQSFPDGFVFHGAMNSSFRQIGNAVPPLMALAIADRIYQDAICTIRSRSAGGKAVQKRKVA